MVGAGRGFSIPGFRPQMFGQPPIQQQPQKGALRSVYDSAVEANANDYDSINKGYDNVINSIKNQNGQNKVNFSPVSSIRQESLPGYQYNRNPDLADTISRYQDFADTGGYSDSDISNIRERSISPLRAVYANAERELGRHKALSGGYAPNQGAILSKLAREQGELQSNANIGINAEIAKMVQSGKLSALNSLSPILSHENDLVNSIGERNNDTNKYVSQSNTQDERDVRGLNANMKMHADEFNAAGNQQNNNTVLSALSGKTNLYGTNPALTQTFANQVLQNNQQNMEAIQIANQIKNARAGLQLNTPKGPGAGAGFVVPNR